MYVRTVTFRLQGIDEPEYLSHVAPIAPSFLDWPGLRTKTWIRDRETGRYGGVYVFESRDAADASRDTPLFSGMIANPAFVDLVIQEFEVIEELTALTTG